jgi:hypothetical protein
VRITSHRSRRFLIRPNWFVFILSQKLVPIDVFCQQRQPVEIANLLSAAEMIGVSEDDEDFTSHLCTQNDADLAQMHMRTTREKLNHLTLQAQIVKTELCNKLTEVKGLNGHYDGIMEQIASLEREVGKWRTLLTDYGDCKSLSLSWRCTVSYYLSAPYPDESVRCMLNVSVKDMTPESSQYGSEPESDEEAEMPLEKDETTLAE